MVSIKYQSTQERRSNKFRAMIKAMGFGAAARLHEISGISVASIRASNSPTCPWSDAKTRRFEASLGVPSGWLDDGEPVPPYSTPILDGAGLRSWLCANASLPVSTDLIPLMRFAEIKRVLWGDQPGKRHIERDITLPARGQLVAIVCPEDVPPPLSQGDTAIFQLGAAPVPGLAVLAYIPRHGFTIRRYRERHTATQNSFELSSPDSSFPTFRVSRPEDGQIVGALIQMRRNFF